MEHMELKKKNNDKFDTMRERELNDCSRESVFCLFLLFFFLQKYNSSALANFIFAFQPTIQLQLWREDVVDVVTTGQE